MAAVWKVLAFLFCVDLSLSVVVVFKNEFSSNLYDGNDLVGLGALLQRKDETLTFFESPDLSSLNKLPLLTLFSRSYVCDDLSLGEDELTAKDIVTWYEKAAKAKGVKIDKLVVVVISCDGDDKFSKGVNVLDDEAVAAPAHPGTFLYELVEGLKKTVKDVMVVGTMGYAVIDINAVDKTRVPFRVFDSSKQSKVEDDKEEGKIVEIPKDKAKSLEKPELKTISEIASALLKTEKEVYLNELKDNNDLFFESKQGFVAAPLKDPQFRQKRRHSRLQAKHKSHNRHASIHV